MDHLPLQVRQRDHVVVDHAERADARSGEIEQDRRAKTAGANHQHARAAERGLSGAAHLAQHDMARVPFKFLGAEHVGPCRATERRMKEAVKRRPARLR